MLKDTEESVQQDLQPDGCGLSPIQHQTGNVKHDIGLYHFHRHPEVINVPVSKLSKAGKTEEREIYEFF